MTLSATLNRIFPIVPILGATSTNDINDGVAMQSSCHTLVFPAKLPFLGGPRMGGGTGELEAALPRVQGALVIIEKIELSCEDFSIVLAMFSIGVL